MSEKVICSRCLESNIKTDNTVYQIYGSDIRGQFIERREKRTIVRYEGDWIHRDPDVHHMYFTTDTVTSDGKLKTLAACEMVHADSPVPTAIKINP